MSLPVPELPEVETVRLGLNQVTLNQVIEGGDVLLERTVAYPDSAIAFLAELQGRAISQWHRRGKYLLAELQEGSASTHADAETKPEFTRLGPSAAGYLGVHLRMTGQLLWVPQSDPLQKHARVRFFLGQGQELRFVDQRTFGQMWYVPPGIAPEVVMTGLSRLGPEPLSPEFSVPYFAEKLRDRQRPIKNALLDQALVAGIGNIYADEALFLSGLRPTTLCAKLKPKQIAQLHGAIRQVLHAAIAARGTTFSDFRDVAGINGNYGGIAWVYDREGQPCRTCGGEIQRLKIAGRSAHFCLICQR
ncbi:DNA-formamidopyrimidine glycosylase [Leptolyngbya sp. AN02str]|uniref:DNA-formamidopyrimidine glycosylase n=1 Tax=Leptolyngbya sp. AN02str TaxID=3423363 RepID=UPI003D3131CB